MISGESQAAAKGAEQFAQVYRALRQDPSVQFNLTPPVAQPKPPAWLEALFRWLAHLFEPVGRFLAWLASFFPSAAYARIFLWSVIALGGVVLAWAIYNRVKHGEWRLRPSRAALGDIAPAPDEWTPAEAVARSWLDEADALAREGRYAEAIHHLLFRSVEDIARRRPALVRPALTSRELAATDGIPSRPRELFSRIAGLVERSLFGGRSVGEPDWTAARQAYADFALPASWRG